MTQASLRQQLVRSLQLTLQTVDWRGLYRSLDRFQGVGGWLISLTLLVVLMWWNWQLVLATGAGLLAMLLLYGMQQSRWQKLGWHWQRVWSRSNRQLTVAVGGGGLVTVSSYLATTVLIESDNLWLALGTILQGLGTLAVLLLLLWQNFSRPQTAQAIDYDQMLASLTDADSLKRLVAIRRATHWAINAADVSGAIWSASNPDATKTHLVDCFRLMLSRETEPTLRTALLDGLQALSHSNTSLEHGNPPLSIPIATAREEKEQLVHDPEFLG